MLCYISGFVVFVEVANCLSFTTAAKNLYISQQAVSKQIDALEEELGFPLFYRTTRQVVLTPAGSRFCGTTSPTSTGS